MIRYELHTGDLGLASLSLGERELHALGVLLVQQVKERFRTRGMSGNVRWPEKAAKSWGYDDGRNPLTGRTGVLQSSFVHVIDIIDGDRYAVAVESAVPYAMVHQLGTVGKGGVLPTIKPRKARALFIPITDKAARATGFSGQEATYVRHVTGASSLSGKVKALVIHGKKGPRIEALRKGRLHDGRLQVWDEEEGEYVNGIPDFIFLSKVDIPARPMLPDSSIEQEEQAGFIRTMIERHA